MIKIREIQNRKDVKDFIEFPLKLYKNVFGFVPPIYSDEKKLITRQPHKNIAESKFFLAERDGKIVGRIQAILHYQYNELKNERRVRFTRFDAIDDKEVAAALFGAVEDFAKEKGMDTVCGPLGYSDLDREGMLIEGFDEDSTFEEQYNYEYYGRLMDACGYKKEVDWLEFELKAPEKPNPMLKRVAERALEMNKLHIASTDMSKRKYINKYKDSTFECIDECYSKLYGTVPISEKMRKELLSQFMLILNKEYLFLICDENDRVVAFGLCFPNIGAALKKSGGRLTLPAILKLLKIVRNPEVIDLGLVAVRPEYQSSGVSAAILYVLSDMLCSGRAKKCETNLNLETNVQVMAQWKHFSARQHKRRRSYIKELSEKD